MLVINSPDAINKVVTNSLYHLHTSWLHHCNWLCASSKGKGYASMVWHHLYLSAVCIMYWPHTGDFWHGPHMCGV